MNNDGFLDGGKRRAVESQSLAEEAPTHHFPANRLQKPGWDAQATGHLRRLRYSSPENSQEHPLQSLQRAERAASISTEWRRKPRTGTGRNGGRFRGGERTLRSLFTPAAGGKDSRNPGYRCLGPRYSSLRTHPSLQPVARWSRLATPVFGDPRW